MSRRHTRRSTTDSPANGKQYKQPRPKKGPPPSLRAVPGVSKKAQRKAAMK